MSTWTEHQNSEGRTYWFNATTRESVWEKPDDLKTPFERALVQTKWKEYFSGGRKYYYNTESRESKWEMPEELLLLLERVEKEVKPQLPTGLIQNGLPAPNIPPGAGGPMQMQGALVPMGGANSSLSTPGSQSTPNSLGMNGTNGAVGPHTGGLPFQPQGALPARPNMPDDPVIPHNGFTTVEEGEKAFMHLLRKAGVDANWTWDQTMRAIITDPLYKALNTLAEKKAAWQKYTDNLKAKEQEEREARLSKLRPAIRNMLKGNPLVFHYTSFATADQLFAQHPIWQQAKIESERRSIFEEYVNELRQREVQETRAARSRSINKVVALFKKLDVDVLTRWRSAHNMVLKSEEWQSDPELQKLPSLDILLAFEDYSRVREREFEEQMRRQQVEKTRKERKAREGFKALLQELVASGKIKARTKWKQVYPSFSEDERYLNMLGNPGSNPLELFWDVADALDQKLDTKVALAEGAIQRYNVKLGAVKGEEAKEKEKEQEGEKADGKTDGEAAHEENEIKPWEIKVDTRFEDFENVLKLDDDEAVQQLATEDSREIFATLHDIAVKRQEEEKRRAERKQRHLQDDLRYALKKLPEPLDLNLSYEEALPLIQDLPEFKALEDEARRAAYSKFIKRQKERLREREASEDGGSTTSRKRKEPSSRDHREERDRIDRDKERDKDRDRGDSHRDHDSSRGSRHHHRYDDYEPHGRSSRDYSREKDYARERDKDYYSGRGKHHKDYDYDDRRRSRGSRSEYGAAYGPREWEDTPAYAAAHEGAPVPPPPPPGYRERSASVYREDVGEKRRGYDDRELEDRAEKRAKYSREPEPAPEVQAPPTREETPEEGEI